jgi:hypothetical protein
VNVRKWPEHVAKAIGFTIIFTVAFVGGFGALIVGLYLVFVTITQDSEPAYSHACSPEYTYVCIHQTKKDWNCDELSEWDFKSVGSDPYRLDNDHNGIACESP